MVYSLSILILSFFPIYLYQKNFQDHLNVSNLLARENVVKEKLMEFTKNASFLVSNEALKKLEFAKNHYGEPDLLIFDFSTPLNSVNSLRFVVRKGRTLFLSLVGDSLREPFWPLGTGIACGFMGAFDTAWAIRSWANGSTPASVINERESIFTMLSKLTPDKLSKNFNNYSIDPYTRY